MDDLKHEDKRSAQNDAEIASDELADKVMYLLDGNIKFYKTLADLKAETGEQKLGKALTKILSENV